jgi:hypothetical protein
MRSAMRKIRIALSFTLLLLVGTVIIQPLPAATGEETIEVQVSPSTIILLWEAKGDVKVTVHTDVSYGLFNDPDYEVNVSLGGVAANYIKADARGDLVAKFDFDAVANLVDVGYAWLTLEAVDENGVSYTGSDRVRVVSH